MRLSQRRSECWVVSSCSPLTTGLATRPVSGPKPAYPSLALHPYGPVRGHHYSLSSVPTWHRPCIRELAREHNTCDHVCEVIDSPGLSRDSSADDCFRCAS